MGMLGGGLGGGKSEGAKKVSQRFRRREVRGWDETSRGHPPKELVTIGEIWT